MPELKMPDINNVFIAGTVTVAPTLRQESNGTAVADFYIAATRKYRDNSGIWRENVCHVGVVVWQKLAETCMQELKVGSMVLVDGELQSKNWKNESGSSRSVVEIRARRIQFLEPGTRLDTSEGKKPESTDRTSESTEKEEKISQETHQDIESTDFDFGYENLKI